MKSFFSFKNKWFCILFIVVLITIAESFIFYFAFKNKSSDVNDGSITSKTWTNVSNNSVAEAVPDGYAISGSAASDGEYQIYVKDAVGNISSPYSIVVQ